MELTYLSLISWSRFHKSDHCRDKGQDWDEAGKRQREYEESEIFGVTGSPCTKLWSHKLERKTNWISWRRDMWSRIFRCCQKESPLSLWMVLEIVRMCWSLMYIGWSSWYCCATRVGPLADSIDKMRGKRVNWRPSCRVLEQASTKGCG